MKAERPAGPRSDPLRGINVGGKAKVPMPELRQVFEQLGAEDVSTRRLRELLER